MKRRRNATASCVECEMDFESNRSLEKHLRSRNHEQRMLALRNLSWLDFQEQSETTSEGLFNQEINSSQHLQTTTVFLKICVNIKMMKIIFMSRLMRDHALTMNRTATSFTHSPARCFSCYIATCMVL